MFRPAQAETSDPYFEYGSESPDDEESATRRRVAWLAAKRRATQPRSPGLNRRGRPWCYAIAIGGLSRRPPRRLSAVEATIPLAERVAAREPAARSTWVRGPLW